MSLRGRASRPGTRDSSSLPRPSPRLQSAGSTEVGRHGSLEDQEEEVTHQNRDTHLHDYTNTLL